MPDVPAWTIFVFAALCAAAGTILLLTPAFCLIRRKHVWGNWHPVSSKIDKRRCLVCGRCDHAYSDYWLRVTQPVECGTRPLPVATTDTNAIPLLPNGRRASMPAPPRHGRVIDHVASTGEVAVL